jgi:hypothetical protein
MSIEDELKTSLQNNGEPSDGVTPESAKVIQFVTGRSMHHNSKPKVVPLDNIEAYLRSYLSFPNDQPFLPLTLFVLLEHCWDECFDEVPYLLISAATQGSGKTRVLELLLFLAGGERAILLDGDITRAALYTEIETMQRVILIDEAEKLQSTSSPFRPILNSGYRRGATVLRKIGGENEEFSIFCPKVMAQIGDVYSSLRDRCITIEMRRMQDGPRKEFVQQVAKEEGHTIIEELSVTLPEYLDDIRNAYLNYHELYPKSLDFLQQGRDKEIWKPLFAICQVIAPERIPELSKSAIDIATFKTRPIRRIGDLRDEEEKMRRLEYTERLVRDALTLIGERDRITTTELVKSLRDIPTAPWRSYEGAGITDISLAAMLKLFGVEPKTIRVKPKGEPHSTAKGYLRAEMAAGTSASLAQPDVEPERNPVTQPVHVATKPSRSVSPILPILDQCGGCKDMHKGIAEKAGAHPEWSDEKLAEDSGCSLTIVRQAKARHIAWKKEDE